MDLKPIYKSNTWQSKYLDIFNQIKNELLPVTFLTASENFQSILSEVYENVNSNSNDFNDSDVSSIVTDEDQKESELNEIIAHEIRHIDQDTTGSYNTKVSKLLKTERKYYTKPHELDAQIFGFKRISKLTKTPFDVVVKRWFKIHKNLQKETLF